MQKITNIKVHLDRVLICQNASLWLAVASSMMNTISAKWKSADKLVLASIASRTFSAAHLSTASFFSHFCNLLYRVDYHAPTRVDPFGRPLRFFAICRPQVSGAGFSRWPYLFGDPFERRSTESRASRLRKRGRAVTAPRRTGIGSGGLLCGHWLLIRKNEEAATSGT